MRPALFSSEKGLVGNVMAGLAAIVIFPVSMILKVATQTFEKPFHRSADEVLHYLSDFLNGTGGEWDWDDFTSIPIEDRRLNAIRKRAAALSLPLDDAGQGQLRALIAEVDRIAAETGG